MPKLAAKELATAAQLTPVYQADAATLGAAALLGRVRASALSGDQVAMYLWLRHIDLGRLRQTAGGDEQAAVGELSRLLAGFRQQLTTREYDRDITEATELASAAGRLRLEAEKPKMAEEFAASAVFPPNAVVIPDEPGQPARTGAPEREVDITAA